MNMNNKQIKAFIASMVLGVNLAACNKSSNPKEVENLIQDKSSISLLFPTFLQDNPDYQNIINKLENAFTNEEVYYDEDNVIRNKDNTKNIKVLENEYYITIYYTVNNRAGAMTFTKDGQTVSNSIKENIDNQIKEYTSYQVGFRKNFQYHYYTPDLGNLTIGIYAPYNIVKLSYSGSRVEIYLKEEQLQSIGNIMQEGNLDFIIDNASLIEDYLRDIYTRKIYYFEGSYINADNFQEWVTKLDSSQIGLKRTKERVN